MIVTYGHVHQSSFPESKLLHAIVLSGHAAVMEQSSLLERLAERHSQAGAMNWLSFFLATPVFGRKKPYLVLIVRPGVTGLPLHLEDVHAAVLLFEYRILGLPTGAFSTDDWSGFRTVIAPAAERGAIAAMAADALLEHGAQIMLVSYANPAQSTSKLKPTLRHQARWAWQTRRRSMALPLESTIKATLAKLGKSTRFNLGYYRRRVEAEVPCEFVADARGLLQERELKALNAGSLNPVRLSKFRLQCESSCQLPGGFLLGLRSTQGQWLSLIGGWRQAGVSVLYWQMNTAGYEKLSIGTAMRSYYLEHEVGHGTKTLIIYGGTVHSMGHSFVREDVTDLIVQRRSWRAAALYAVARILASPRSFIRIDSLLVQAISDKYLDWHSADAKDRRPEPQSQGSGLL
jgi:hypothetical protein